MGCKKGKGGCNIIRIPRHKEITNILITTILIKLLLIKKMIKGL